MQTKAFCSLITLTTTARELTFEANKCLVSVSTIENGCRQHSIINVDNCQPHSQGHYVSLSSLTNVCISNMGHEFVQCRDISCNAFGDFPGSTSRKFSSTFVDFSAVIHVIHADLLLLYK